MPFDGTNLNEVQLTLIAARALIKKGWCQRAFKKELKKGEHYCVVGAIQQVVYGSATQVSVNTPDQVELVGHSKRVLLSAIGPDLGYIEVWNDQRDRKKSEVLAAFDRAIAAGLE